MIDIDECGIYLQTAKRTNGKAYLNVRVRDEGPYGHDVKYTLIAAVAADGYRYMRFERKSGTTAIDFADFIAEVITQIPLANVNRKLFLWDNLSAHHSALVTNTVDVSGHGRRARPAYRPEDGPIEYVFNTLHQELCARMYTIVNEIDLIREVNTIFTQMGTNGNGFDNYFARCGYAP
jgi:transposase